MDGTGSLHAQRAGVVLDDRYELIELIGSGGMAEVWRAHDIRLDRDVAVKLLSGGAYRDESRRRRIEREARALAATSHPNIVAVYDYGEEEAPGGELLPYVVMELVDGPDLHRYLSSTGPLPVDEARDIMLGVLAAVERAHTAGVVHGDLKPANVYMSSHGPKVGDFGVARILEEETGMTTAAATPTFAAPEVLKGERPTASSDVYSAGCLAFELLTGRAPFIGANGWEIATKHLEAPIPRVRKLRSDVPSTFDDAIQRAMDKTPRRRFLDAASFAHAVGGVRVVAPPATETVPVAAVGLVEGPEPTQALTHRRPPRPERVALLGPLAIWWDRIAHRSKEAGDRVAPSPNRRLLLAVLVGFLLLFAFFLMRDPGPELVALADVRGETVTDAINELRVKGFKVSDVSYSPITQGEPNRVIRTIPKSKSMVEPGTEVHLIAGAIARTPEPVVRQPAGGDDDDEKPGRKGRKDRD